MITIKAFPSGPFATNAYIVACLATKQAAIIDPAPESSDALCAYLSENKLTLDKILLTHSHWDHIADVAKLKNKFSVPVYIFPEDAPNLEIPGSDGVPCFIQITGVKADHHMQEGEMITIGSLSLEVIHTPGHTPGGVCFYCKQHGRLISGDTLFKGTIGNLNLPTGQPHRMWNSLSKLSQLPAETIVYPGHGPSTSIGAESWLSDAKRVFGS